MISFLQQILQKHHKWVFSILLTVIIIAFVFTIGATPGLVGKKKTAMFYGVNLISKQDTQRFINSAIISSLSSGKMIYSTGQLDSAVLMRIALLAKADELLIPEADDEALSKFIGTMKIFRDDSGEFSQDKYQNFQDICAKHGFSKHEIRQSLIDDQRINILGHAISGNGYFSEKQLRSLLSIFYSEYDILVGDFNYNSFDFSSTVTNEELREFYDCHIGRYTQPKMFAVSIVKFDADKLKKKVKIPNKEVLRKFFTENQEKFKKGKSFEEEYDDVVEEFTSIASRKLASEKADAFVYELYSKNIELNSDEFQKLLDTFGVTKKPVAAYSRLKLPTVPGVPESALYGVFDLDESRYYSDAFSAGFGAAVLLVEKRKESRILSFDESKAYIKNDIIDSRKSTRFKETVDDLRIAMNQLSSRKQVISKMNAYHIGYDEYKNISLSKDSNALSPEHWGTLSSIPKNETVGVLQRGKDGVSFVVILRRDTPKMNDMLEWNGDKFKNQLLQSNRNFEFVEYVNWLVQKELVKLK